MPKLPYSYLNAICSSVAVAWPFVNNTNLSETTRFAIFMERREYAPLKYQDPNDKGLKKRRYFRFLLNKVAWLGTFSRCYLKSRQSSCRNSWSAVFCHVCERVPQENVSRSRWPAFFQLHLSCFIFVIEVWIGRPFSTQLWRRILFLPIRSGNDIQGEFNR